MRRQCSSLKVYTGARRVARTVDSLATETGTMAHREEGSCPRRMADPFSSCLPSFRHTQHCGPFTPCCLLHWEWMCLSLGGKVGAILSPSSPLPHPSLSGVSRAPWPGALLLLAGRNGPQACGCQGDVATSGPKETPSFAKKALRTSVDLPLL